MRSALHSGRHLPEMHSDFPSMAGKVVLITGGTGGIGKATAIGLAILGARVGIVGRDRARAGQSAADIHAASGNWQIDAFAADMTSQAEVRKLAGAVHAAYPRLDVVINNVGGFWAHRHSTADGLERTFALNHLAPFLLTNLLLDRLMACAPARVVNVSSGAQSMGRIDFDDLQGTRGYSGQRAYSQSKLANVVFTNELARRLAGTGVTATSLHPGVVSTSFGAEDQATFFAVISSVVKPFLKMPAQGAQTSIYLASSPDVEGVSGEFFASRKPKTANRAAYDLDLGARLWRISADLVGVTATAAA
jgi:retinol dehydrogenase 14